MTPEQERVAWDVADLALLRVSQICKMDIREIGKAYGIEGQVTYRDLETVLSEFGPILKNDPEFQETVKRVFPQLVEQPQPLTEEQLMVQQQKEQQEVQKMEKLSTEDMGSYLKSKGLL